MTEEELLGGLNELTCTMGVTKKGLFRVNRVTQKEFLCWASRG
jgi:hypothetical protein